MKAYNTERAVEKATFDLAEREERRRHLGASVIGDKCTRKIWYKFRWAFDGNPHPARLLRLFKRGHREEPEIISLLRQAGLVVYAAGESGEAKESLRISDVDGHFGGTPDGVATAVPDLPTELPVLLEIKTMNDKQFQQTKEDGVMTAHWEYFIQMQIYMEKHALTKALFIVVNKNDDELYFEIVSANPPQAEAYLKRARDIIYATTPPPRIADSQAKYPCKFCDYASICHVEDFPAINCRTCAHVSVGPGGQWLCARNRDEVATQGGCDAHLYDPRWFDSWTVTDYNQLDNWMEINNKVETFVHGNHPRGHSSAWLLEHGLVPF